VWIWGLGVTPGEPVVRVDNYYGAALVEAIDIID